MKENSIPNSLYNTARVFLSLLKTMYKNMPLLMIVFTSLIIYLATKLSSNTTTMVGILSAVIIISSICIYVKSNNYGEAVLALSAGLFTVYTVEWTPLLFMGFIIVWILFTVIVFFISSVRIASRIESILLDAAISLPSREKTDKEMMKKLEVISNSVKNSMLMPDERAEILRLLCFRKIEIDKMQTALNWVNLYYGITKIPYMDLASFVSEVIKNTTLYTDITIDNVFDYIYVGMRETPVSPLEYIDIFKKTRHILASTKSTILYFQTLNDFFLSGKPVSRVEEYVESIVVID